MFGVTAWVKARPVTRSVLDEGSSVTRSVLGEGSACHKVCIERRIGLSQGPVLSEGSAYHEGCMGEYEREKTADVHHALLDGSQRDKCKEN